MNPLTHTHSFKTLGLYTAQHSYVPQTFEECWRVSPT